MNKLQKGRLTKHLKTKVRLVDGSILTQGEMYDRSLHQGGEYEEVTVTKTKEVRESLLTYVEVTTKKKEYRIVLPNGRFFDIPKLLFDNKEELPRSKKGK